MALDEMGARGRQWMKREFGPEPLAEHMKSVYRNLISASN
jgi:hypothetical protein